MLFIVNRKECSDMDEVIERRYRCGICKHEYKTAREALECEESPLREGKGVKIGDTVMITGGQGSGCLAKVESLSVAEKYWCQGSWKYYWHTVMVSAHILEGQHKIGSRWLTFDQYYIIEPIERTKG